MLVALDATYGVGGNLSGVGVYSREMMHGLAAAHPDAKFLFCFRPQRRLASLKQHLPRNARRATLLSRIPRADLFHALNQRAPERRTGIPVVTTFHDLFVMTSGYSTPEFRERFTAQARQAAARSDRIIAVSRFTASQIEALLGVDRTRIRVIPHGTSRTPAGDDARRNLILFVGAIQRRKNIARLIRAFEPAPPGWKLVLAGSQDGFEAVHELSALEKSSRRADIDVPGYVSERELDALWARAKIFAFPSLDEGFGMPVLDAMASGVPVITSNRSALPEAVGDAALLVDPFDQDAIASAICRLTADESLRADLTRAGLDRAREFTWKRALEATWSVYHELV